MDTWGPKSTAAACVEYSSCAKATVQDAYKCEVPLNRR